MMAKVENDGLNAFLRFFKQSSLLEDFIRIHQTYIIENIKDLIPKTFENK
jgi:hypothetical protein